MIKCCILFLFLVSLFGCGDYCEKTIKPIKIKGKIVDKYIDDYNHATKTVKYNENNTDFLIAMYDSELWDYISIGDSIFKDNNSLTFKIKREKETIGFDYPCSH